MASTMFYVGVKFLARPSIDSSCERKHVTLDPIGGIRRWPTKTASFLPQFSFVVFCLFSFDPELAILIQPTLALIAEGLTVNGSRQSPIPISEEIGKHTGTFIRLLTKGNGQEIGVKTAGGFCSELSRSR
jgi:hypothetical protein